MISVDSRLGHVFFPILKLEALVLVQVDAKGNVATILEVPQNRRLI